MTGSIRVKQGFNLSEPGELYRSVFHSYYFLNPLRHFMTIPSGESLPVPGTVRMEVLLYLTGELSILQSMRESSMPRDIWRTCLAENTSGARFDQEGCATSVSPEC